MNQMSVVVAEAGPPLVMIAMMSKAWNDARVCVMTRKNVVGDSSGSTTLRNTCTELAPSRRAASSTSEGRPWIPARYTMATKPRSEEHTSELQSRGHLVCRLLLEKKKKSIYKKAHHEDTRDTRR